MWCASPLIPYPASSAKIGAPRRTAQSRLSRIRMPASLTHHKAVPVDVPGAASVLEFIIPGRESLHGREPADAAADVDAHMFGDVRGYGKTRSSKREL